MSGIASEMFIGRDRFATSLLTKLTETVILWLSDDPSFWDDIEEGPKPLGPIGLLQVICLLYPCLLDFLLTQLFTLLFQFYLDMKFVVQFATQNRLLSRLLNQVIRKVTGRAIDAFAATGVDPNR